MKLGSASGKCQFSVCVWITGESSPPDAFVVRGINHSTLFATISFPHTSQTLTCSLNISCLSNTAFHLLLIIQRTNKIMDPTTSIISKWKMLTIAADQPIVLRQSLFLDLLGEIRNKIYDHVFGSKTVHIVDR